MNEMQALFLKQQLESLGQMKEMAEDRARASMAALHRVAQGLVPAAYDELKKQDKLPRTAEQFATFIINKVQARQFALEIQARAAKSDPQEIERLRAGLQAAQTWKETAETATGEVAILKSRITAKDQEIAKLQRQIRRLNDEIRAAQLKSQQVSPLDEDEAVPVRISGKSKLNLSKAAIAALRVLGSTGACLRSVVIDTLISDGTISGENSRMFRDLSNAGLLEELKPRQDIPGNTPYLIRLTEAGMQAYQRYFNRPAVLPKLDELLRRHKGLSHVFLNLRTADIFEQRFGYIVDRLPQAVQVDGHQIAPDLAMTRGEKTIYVEVERTTKKSEAFAQKINNMMLLNGDNLYFVVPDTPIQSSIVSQASIWYYNAHRTVNLHICNLSILDKEATEPWTMTRAIG